MADNTVVINPAALSASGDTIATDDIGGVKYQRIKLGFGDDGIYVGDVSETNPLPTSLAPGGTTADAFGRFRVSGQTVLGYGSFHYGANSEFVETKVNGTGAVANLTNEASISLTNGGPGNGAYAYAATRVFHRYTPGRSQLVKFTGSFGTPAANVRQRAGYFSSQNGLFLEYDGTTLYAVRRTFTSGGVVDNRVARSAWQDPMDGTGPSGINLDLTKTWLAWIDLEWLGVGRYRLGFANPSNGALVTAFEGAGVNTLSVPYMTTASLPVRYEIENTAGTAATTTMKWICYSVDSEGGDEADLPQQIAVNTIVAGGQTCPNNTRVPVLAIRAKTTGPNSVANRGQILLKSVSAIVLATTPICFEIWVNPTTLTDSGGAISWTSAGALTEYFDFSAGALDTIVGGTMIESFFVAASNQARGTSGADLVRRLPIVYTELGSVQDTIVLVGIGLGASSTCQAQMTMQELF